jgi:hypothetical protein
MLSRVTSIVAVANGCAAFVDSVVSWCLGEDDAPVSAVDVRALLTPGEGSALQLMTPRAVKRTLIRVLASAHLPEVRRALQDGVAAACHGTAPLVDQVRQTCLCGFVSLLHAGFHPHVWWVLHQGVYIQASAIAALEAANAAFVEAGLDPLRRHALVAQPATSTIEVLVSALRYCVPTGILRLNLRQQGEAVTSTPTDGYARWGGGRGGNDRSCPRCGERGGGHLRGCPA